MKTKTSIQRFAMRTNVSCSDNIQVKNLSIVLQYAHMFTAVLYINQYCEYNFFKY